jgi:hypothetical protein
VVSAANFLDILKVVLEREVFRWIWRVLLPVEKEFSAGHDSVVVESDIRRHERTNNKSISGKSRCRLNTLFSKSHVNILA